MTEKKPVLFGRVIYSIGLQKYYAVLEFFGPIPPSGWREWAHQTGHYTTVTTAKAVAQRWAQKNGYRIRWKKYRPGMNYEM